MSNRLVDWHCKSRFRGEPEMVKARPAYIFSLPRNQSVISIICLAFLASSLAGRSEDSGELLYNGIRLPAQWPPSGGEPTSWEPMEVPWAKEIPDVIPIDVGRQLFVDDFLVEQTTCTRRFHTAQKYEGNPVLKPETEEELEFKAKKNPKMDEVDGQSAICGFFHGGAFYDPIEHTYKLWYAAGVRKSLALATSNNGFHWTRAAINNASHLLPAMPEGAGGGDNCVWFDAGAPVNERIKVLTNVGTTHKLFTLAADARTWSASVTAYQPWILGEDKKTFIPPANAKPGEVRVSDYCSFFYNPFRKVWCYSLKKTAPNPRARVRYYAEAKDFMTRGAFENSVFWVGADKLDEPDPVVKDPPQLYSLNAVAYESLMVGMFYIHLGPHNRICEQQKTPKLTELKVGFSRNGFHWARPDRRAFIAASRQEGTWDRGYLHSTAGIFFVDGDRLIFPYAGCSGVAPDGKRGMYTGTSIGIATLRRDGFASMDAEGRGTLTTRKVKFSGKRLFVNVACPQGKFTAEVLDENDKVIAPFAAENCVPITADNTIQEVIWKSGGDLSSWAGKPVKFRFYLDNAQLYSFWVSRDESGASMGYVAAGGPGYPGVIDTVGKASKASGQQ